MAFRDIPRDIKDEKDMESFLRALRDKAVSVTSHSELKDIKEVDKSSTDTSRNKHVSDYDMKKVEDHMDDVSKHLAQELTGGSNYLSTLTGTSPVVVSGTGTSRNVEINQGGISHINIANIGINTHDQIDTHIGLTTNPHSTSDANLVTTDVTTNNVSTSKHGFVPKLPNDAAKYFDGIGLYSVPPSSGEVNTASNVGTGQGVFKTKSGVDLQFYKILGSVPIGISLSSDDIVINVNSASISIGMLKMTQGSVTGTLGGTTTVNLLVARYAHLSDSYFQGVITEQTLGLSTGATSFTAGLLFSLYNSSGTNKAYGLRWDYHS